MITGAGSGHASECVKHCVEANKINNLDRCYLVERNCLPHRSRAFELVIGIVFSCCHEKHYESNERLSYQLNTMPAQEIHVLIDQIINHLVIHLIFFFIFFFVLQQWNIRGTIKSALLVCARVPLFANFIFVW